MKSTTLYTIILVIVFITLSFVYQNFLIGPDLDKVFLTVITFLFSIIIGFSITREGSRYSFIRKAISDFDGNLSAIYRNSSHLEDNFKSKIEEIIKEHYKKIVDTQSWSYHFVNKSSTITDIHIELESLQQKEQHQTVQHFAIQQILISLRDLQQIRKHIVALKEERLSILQWIVISILGAILFYSLSVIPSVGDFTSSLIKAASVTAVLSVVVVLRLLENLKLFEGRVGEQSSRDVVEIIYGEK